MAHLVMAISILHNLGDVSDTKIISVPSTFLFLWLEQMFRLVEVGIVSSLVAEIFGDIVAGILGDIVAGILGDIVAGIAVDVVDGIVASLVGSIVVSLVAGEDDGIGNGKVMKLAYQTSH